MRAALIALPFAGEDALPVIGGKTIAARQLAFAREAGCGTVIAYGNGASTDAIDLRHAAERMGMKFQVVSTAHALPGIIGDGDSLLVLQPGLLPESRAALELVRAEGDRVLVVSAGPGANAGFERIDLDRAWAGALTIPGKWLGQLASLPEEIAPHGALLRIALQHRLPEARLADEILDDGRWSLVLDTDAAASRALTWQRTHLGDVSPASLSRWLGTRLVTLGGSGLASKPHSRPALLGVAAALLGGAVTAGFHGHPVPGFLLAALASPVLEAFLALSRLEVAPFGRVKRLPWLRWLLDATLLVVGVLAIDSLLHRTIFPPLVLAAALLMLDRRKIPSFLEPLRDRMIVPAIAALLALVATPELAIMIVAIAVLLANLAPSRG